jgi:AraC-like DNA-binding protein
LRRRFTVEARPVRDIAAEIGCNKSTVYRALQAARLSRDGSSYRSSYGQLRDTQWLRQRYLVQGARMKDIAAEVGGRGLAVREALVRAKIPLRGVSPVYPQLRDRDWLRQQHAEQHSDVPGIAARLGCHPDTVRLALVAAGIPRTDPTRPRRRRFPALADQEWLRRRYLAEHASLPELAREIGCSIRAVRTALTEAQVPMRPQGQWKGRRLSTGASADTTPSARGGRPAPAMDPCRRGTP